MAFNKIQPEQVQMPTFFSDSGDIRIGQLDTGIKLNISRGLTGDFAFTGQLLTNGKSVFGLANTGTNNFNVDFGNLLFQGTDTDLANGPNDGFNVGIIANSSEVSGVNNLIINGYNTDFQTGTHQNTAAGRNITFTNTATGCIGLKDSKATTSLSISDPHSMHVQFDSGVFFEGGNVYASDNSLTDGSGIFSGNLEVLGSSLFQGATRFTETTRFETGFSVPIWLGNSMTAGTPTAPATGSLAISGTTLVVFVGASQWGGIAISGGNP
jgi:hypothetical protein